MMQFIPIDNPNSDDVFELTKSGLFPFVDEVFGWDDVFQRQRLKDDYQPNWFYWVVYNGKQIGLVCFKPVDQALHLHLIVLNSEYQNKGLGKTVMFKLQAMAEQESRDITLSSFKCNVRAIAFYKKLGYQVETEEDRFLLLRKNIR